MLDCLDIKDNVRLTALNQAAGPVFVIFDVRRKPIADDDAIED
jgi:hypothetical protein